MAQVAELQARLGAKLAEDEDDAPERPVAGGTVASPKPKAWDGTRRWVITSAQNNTVVHAGFLAALRTYADEHGSELVVSRYSYNKNAWRESKTTKSDDDLWYAPEIIDFVRDESIELAPGLVLGGELDILPTASDPLSGLENYFRSASGIVPHAKLCLKSLARMKHEAPRTLYTTGTVTQRNYVERKAGQRASFHHVFGALAVEVDIDGAWFVRQLVADDTGAFHDLDRVYTATGASSSRVEALTWGDFHSEKADAVVDAACFSGPESILDTLRPREQHVHDLADFTARNHHNRSSAFFLAEQRASGRDSVEDDIATCAAKLTAIHRDFARTVVVESNHDEAFKRWLDEADGHTDAVNARYWHAWNYRVFDAIERRDAGFHVFAAAVREKLAVSVAANAVFLREDDSWVICREQGGGIECGLHGHRGANGSRGSARGFGRLGIRTNTAHSHSPSITGGNVCAGVSGALDMGYNQGPSSWSHSHIVTYPSGKRAILTMRGPRWRGAPVRVRERECVA